MAEILRRKCFYCGTPYRYAGAGVWPPVKMCDCQGAHLPVLVIRCVCGNELVLDDAWTNRCPCGTEYNGNGQRLDPRDRMNHAPSIPLTKREYSLLLMDIVDVGPNTQTKDIADELRRGCSVHATPALLAELSEFVDRDDDPKEHAAYRRLLHKALAAIKAAEEGHNAD